MEILAELVAELEERAEIRQPEELEAFDSLRLPVEDAVEAAAEILAEVLVELAGETELARTELVRTELARTKLVQTELMARVEIRQLNVRVKIQQLEELKVLLITVRC